MIEREAGAEQVHGIISATIDRAAETICCFVTLTEVEYISLQEGGEQLARQRMADLGKLPIQWIHSDSSLCSAAARLKATHRISFADAFVAATAMQVDAVLVHRDPEFLPLSPPLKQLTLPPKQ
jgi:predicted nucleic acid-binding protein